MSLMGHKRTNGSPAKTERCPLLSKSGQTRVRLDCPLSAINDHCTAANSIDRKTPNHAYFTALPTLHARERLSANQ
jgi:hypothetical protein